MDIRERLNQHLQTIGEVFERFPWESKEHYGWFLAQTYYYVRHSTRLLALASAKFDFGQPEQHYGFAAHINEEIRHEMLAANDLKALGLNIADYPELPEVRSWYHSQYYYIQNVDPAGLLGAVLALEGLSVFKGPWFYDEICKHYNKNAANFIKVHATEDVHHIEGAYKGFEMLRPQQQKVAQESLEQAVWSYIEMVEGIKKRLASKQIPALPKSA